MKKIFLSSIIISITLSGCSLTKIQLWETAYVPSGYDLREYAKDEFLFTPEGYLGDYESIGVVEIMFMPKIREGHTSNRVEIPGFDILVTSVGIFYVERPNTQKIIDEMFKLANNMGADAIMRFNISPTTLNNEGTIINSIRASGFAIKRKD